MNPWELWKTTPFNDMPKEIREEMFKDLLPDLKKMKELEDEANLQISKNI